MSSFKKILLFGIDGLDPNIMEEMMEKGQLPNFLTLSEKGYYCRLRTINPPQSPVVWTSIATGCNPGEHGIYDFLGRTPRNYLPHLSILRIEKNHFVSPIKAKTFWEKASEKGIESTILRWPLTFPPQRINGSMLAGLGVPDMQGNLGTYTYYTNNPDLNITDKKGRIVNVNIAENHIKTEIVGPVFALFTTRKEIINPLDIKIYDGFIKMNIDGANFDLNERSWSEWIPLRFNLGFMRNINGICKFYLKSIVPEFNLYATPINIAYGTDSFPISIPLKYSKELSDDIGLYATLGMPEDANALNDELIDEDAFLIQCNSIMHEREKMFFHELNRFKGGILACIFEIIDIIQHLFWRFIDPSHPMFENKLAHQYSNVIYDYYKWMDKILGKILDTISPDTLLIICSDHGFSSFCKSVHLNTWLVQNSFMSLKNNSPVSDRLFNNVDWNNTKAYALGLNSIYFNIKNREGNGIIQADALPSLKSDLITKLRLLTDGGKKVIKDVYDSNEIYSGEEISASPDLVVGYQSGYRQSWQTAIGSVPLGSIIETNLKKWSGEHCCDAEFVPGVFLSNRKDFLKDPSILDLSPALLAYF